MIAGVDAYKKGWIVAIDDGRQGTRLEVVDTFSALAEHPDLKLMVIDVPIGLPDRGPRTADRQARQMLGPRRNSVFPAPIRPMLGAPTYEEACERRFQIDGKKCSKQLFSILPLITEVDEQMSPSLQNRILEGHPEVSFAALAGAPMRAHKAKSDGRAQRLEVLTPLFPDLEDNIARLNRPGAMADVLDAYALLWTARRIVRGRGQHLPAEPELDTRGLRMEIVY